MADAVLRQSRGGQYASAVTSGNSETLVYTGAGQLMSLSILTAGTASTSIYDGTQSTGGTLLFTTLTNDALGTTKSNLEFPISTGIVVTGTTGSPGWAVIYNKAGPNGT